MKRVVHAPVAHAHVLLVNGRWALAGPLVARRTAGVALGVRAKMAGLAAVGPRRVC